MIARLSKKPCYKQPRLWLPIQNFDVSLGNFLWLPESSGFPEWFGAHASDAAIQRLTDSYRGGASPGSWVATQAGPFPSRQFASPTSVGSQGAGAHVLLLGLCLCFG